MPEITHLLDNGDNIVVFFNDGSRAMAFAENTNLWILGESGIGVPPDDLFIWPFNPDFATSEFGIRSNPFGGGKQEFHSGIDGSTAAGAGFGADVIASGAGTVVAAGWNVYGSWGESVIIDHGIISGNRLRTGYAHMISGSLTVSVGDTVIQGEVLGLVDSTGRSTGNHLHFSTWENGKLINPRNFMMTYA
jgi:murein DD-endopeptidase MepM/ murein hydrolase activator NlpD